MSRILQLLENGDKDYINVERAVSDLTDKISLRDLDKAPLSAPTGDFPVGVDKFGDRFSEVADKNIALQIEMVS